MGSFVQKVVAKSFVYIRRIERGGGGKNFSFVGELLCVPFVLLHAEEHGNGLSVVSSANGLSKHGSNVDDLEFVGSL